MDNELMLRSQLEQVTRERDMAREQHKHAQYEVAHWVDRATKAARERDEARALVDELRGQYQYSVGLSMALEERDQAKRERDQEREACAMYAERSGRFAEQADKLQADLDDCRARSADIRTMLERVTRERDLALERLENESKVANQARMAEERARESLEEIDEAIYDCLPWDDDESPLDCVERAADRLRELAKERDEARAEVARLKAQHLERHLESWEQYMHDNDVKRAYRRGAEAMREACAQWFREHDESFELTVDACHDVIADMPIPEEP